jgi:hypothetical protein
MLCGSCKKDVSEERGVSIITVTEIGELEIVLAVTSNRCVFGETHSIPSQCASVGKVPSSRFPVTLMTGVIRSSETSVITTTQRTIPEDSILCSHRREKLKSYII